VAWKAVLVGLVLAMPAAEGYDSSTEVFVAGGARGGDDRGRGEDAGLGAGTVGMGSTSRSVLRMLGTRLTRWDGIYFVQAGLRGVYPHEQDWAFSFGYTAVLSFLKTCKTPVANRNFCFNLFDSAAFWK